MCVITVDIPEYQINDSALLQDIVPLTTGVIVCPNRAYN